MNNLRQGIWIVNTRKQLSALRGDMPGYQFFEVIDMAGKCGALLSKVTSDQSEIIPTNRLEIYASQSGIRKTEFEFCLKEIEKTGKIVGQRLQDGTIKGIENYCFSTADIIQVVSEIYRNNDPNTTEMITLHSLEASSLMPRKEGEFKNELCNKGYSERDVITALHLQENFHLIGVKRNEFVSEAIIYNEHIFQTDPTKVIRAMEALNDNERQIVSEIQELLRSTPGYPVDRLTRRYPAKIVNIMRGVGLLEELEVISSYGNASFATLPQLRASDSGSSSLLSDIYHKAKLLLNCIRYGQMKSVSSRGRIYDPLLIMNALLDGRRIGPCTAIGEDYKILELQGVIETCYHSGKQYYMKLRQSEVGRLVKDVLLYGTTLPDQNLYDEVFSGFQPDQFIIPEHKRRALETKMSKPVEEMVTRMLETIRT